MMTMNMFTWTRKKLPKEHFYSELVSSRVSSLLVSLIALIMELLLARKDKKNLQQSEIWLPIYKNLLFVVIPRKNKCFSLLWINQYLQFSLWGFIYRSHYENHCIKVSDYNLLCISKFRNEWKNSIKIIGKNDLKFKCNPKNIQQQH